VCSPPAYADRDADAICRSFSSREPVRPRGEWRNFWICVASVLPPGATCEGTSSRITWSIAASVKRPQFTAGLRRGSSSSSRSRSSMKASDAASTGGTSSKLPYTCCGQRE
jgi:hypothetical protein